MSFGKMGDLGTYVDSRAYRNFLTLDNQEITARVIRDMENTMTVESTDGNRHVVHKEDNIKGFTRSRDWINDYWSEPYELKTGVVNNSPT